MIATRIRDSAFKQVLSQMKPGAELVMKGPYGDFVLPEPLKRPVVFITGGIGVTAVRSMLLHAIAHQLPSALLPITVFYANRRPEDAAFLAELTQACFYSDSSTLVATMSQVQESSVSWLGEEGYVDQAMLARHLKDISAPLYYLDGPPELVAAMKTMLSQAGLDAEQIRSEEFAGY